jgi:hypothetical protein
MAALRRIEPMPLIAAASAALAAWFSLGSLAVATVDTRSRFGFLPPLWLLLILTIAFVGAVWRSRLSTPASLPLFFSLVTLLPWIPGRVPAAFLLWTGPVAAAVWLGVIAGMVLPRTSWGYAPRLYIPAAIALAAYLAGGWWLAQILPGGDEPHYLVITQSLLRDGDIRVENNYAQGQYREYFPVPLRPHFGRRGTNGEHYSIHAPGLPAVVAPAFAAFGYPGVVVFLALVAAIGSALLWRAGYLLTGDVSAAWFAWAAGFLTVPFFFEAFAVYPDNLAATLVLFAALPLFDERVSASRWVAIGAALALLPWLHTRFAIISAIVGVVLSLRLIGSAAGRAQLGRLLLIPLLGAIGWFGFFRVIYGTFDPSVPYGGDTQTRAVNMLNGLPALLFDQQFGILPNAPVYGFAFAGLVMLARQRTRLAFEMAAISVTYLMAVSVFHMWWGGSSAPARFLAPVLPLLAIPAAWLWSSTSSAATRAVGVALLLASLTLTAIMAGAESGLLAYNVRDGYSRAADWVNPIVDVSLGMPSFFRHTAGPAILRAGIWIGFVAMAVLLLRAIEKVGSRAFVTVAAPTLLAIAIMCAVSTVWAIDDVVAVNPERSQQSLLASYGARWRPNGVALEPLSLTRAEAALRRIRVVTPTRRQPAAAGTLLLAPAIVPAGTYELRKTVAAPSSGTAKLVIGRLARASRTWDLASDFPNGATILQLPVAVGSLVVTGDRNATPGSLILHPTKIWEGDSYLTADIARRVERYGRALVFFFDASTFPEDVGFWVRGGSPTQFAVATVEAGERLQLVLRNAAVRHEVRLEIDGEMQILNLESREERRIAVPISAHRPGALIRIHPQHGFRPSEVEAGSRDNRFLGAWLEFQ